MTKTTIFSSIMCLVFASSSFAGDLLIRGEINAPDGAEVSFSVPIDVLEAVKTSSLSALIADKEKLNNLVDSVKNDFASMKGKSIIEVNMGKNGVHVYVDEVNGDEPEAANFIQVDIDPAGNKKPDVHLRFPKGLVFLGAFIGNQLMEQHGEDLLESIKAGIMHKAMSPPPAHHAPKPEHHPRYEHHEEDENDDGSHEEEELTQQINPKMIRKIVKEILEELD